VNSGWNVDDEPDHDIVEDTLGDSALEALTGGPPPLRGTNQHSNSRGEDTVSTLLFTARNPERTVSATALLDGRILSVDLTPRSSALTERELAEEISAVTHLARLQARAAQHVIVTGIMGNLGHDRVAVSGHLERDLGLPSPEAVAQIKAKLFAARYAGDDE
jgi:hypothetical protein